MTTIVDFSVSEIANPADFTAIGTHARAADQAINGGAIGYPKHWARFTIAQPTAINIVINGGVLFKDENFYIAPSATNLNLQEHLPLVANDTKWVALLARGKPETIDQGRQRETDSQTGQTMLQMLPKERRLTVEYVVQAGLPSPGPIKPSVPENECCLAFIKLGPAGIILTELAQGWRAKTLYEVEGRVTILEFNLEQLRQRTSTIETDIANVAGQLRNVPRPEVMRQLKRDAAMVRKKLNMPEDARGYWYNPGLLKDDWDHTHANWSARIREGVRFPYAQTVNNQLALLDPTNPRIKIVGNMLMPKWTETPRITVDGDDGSVDISGQVHTITTATQNTVSGVNISYGPTVNVCENAAEWDLVKDKHIGETFNSNGTEYISQGLSTGVHTTGVDLGQWNADPTHEGHRAYAIASVNYEYWSETYWSYHTQTYGINGAIHGNTFLNSQACVSIGFRLKFKRVGSGGDADVNFFLAECDATGAPLLDRVVAQKTLHANQLSVGWVTFYITPTLMKPSKRYAWFTATVGNHALATVSGNKYTQGSRYMVTDGVWAQVIGDNTTDFAFEMLAAKFDDVRTQLLFDPITLPGGMSELQFLFSGWNPAGTGLIWEIAPHDSNDWTIVNEGDPTPLLTMPETVKIRLTMVGTTDLMPALKLDNTARVAAYRHAPNMQAISKARPFGFTSDFIILETVIDNFDPAVHTAVNKLIVDGAFVNPTTTTVEIDFQKPSRRTLMSTFMLAAPKSNVIVAPAATTSNLTKIPFVQNIAMYVD